MQEKIISKRLEYLTDQMNFRIFGYKLGLLASLITIFVFFTGYASIRALLADSVVSDREEEIADLNSLITTSRAELEKEKSEHQTTKQALRAANEQLEKASQELVDSRRQARDEREIGRQTGVLLAEAQKKIKSLENRARLLPPKEDETPRAVRPLENLPASWRGKFQSGSEDSEDKMELKIDNVVGTKFYGRASWHYKECLMAIEGTFVDKFIDPTENQRWHRIEGFSAQPTGPAGRFQMSGVIKQYYEPCPRGTFYMLITDEGNASGVWYRKTTRKRGRSSITSPTGFFSLDYQN